MAQWTEADCLVAAISHLIASRKDLNKRIVAEKAGVSPPYLTLLLKQDRGKALLIYEKIANACDLTIAKAIEIGQGIMQGAALEDLPTHKAVALEEMESIEGLVEVLDDLRQQVQRIEKGHTMEAGLKIDQKVIAAFPYLKTYLQILNQACIAGDLQFAKDTLHRLAEIIKGNGGNEHQAVS